VIDAETGPEIPAMPSALLARKLASGALARPGAATSVGLLDLADFAPEFERWGAVTAITERTN
jgi:hypothetical protein